VHGVLAAAALGVGRAPRGLYAYELDIYGDLVSQGHVGALEEPVRREELAYLGGRGFRHREAELLLVEDGHELRAFNEAQARDAGEVVEEDSRDEARHVVVARVALVLYGEEGDASVGRDRRGDKDQGGER